MKLCMSHYIHKSIPHAQFEADSSSSFGDMTSQSFPLKRGTSYQIRLFIYPWKTGLTFKKWVFMSRIVLLDPNLPPSPNVNFRNFQAEEIFSLSKFLGCLDEKRAAATPLIGPIFKKIWPDRVLRIKSKSHQV